MFQLMLILCVGQALAQKKQDCLTGGVLIYENMGCTPNFDKPNECATSYNCSIFNTPSDKCYYKNKEYSNGERFNDTARGSCFHNCICQVTSAGAKISCTQRQCGNPNFPRNCYATSSLDSCCVVGSKCPNTREEANVHRCDVYGVDYREGEDFYTDTCEKCICQKGYSGKPESPYCIPDECGSHLRHYEKIKKKCAPVYDLEEEGTCCPFEWVCNDGKDIKVTGTATSKEKCSFGDLQLQVGQSFTAIFSYADSDLEIPCSCLVPPLVACTAEDF